MSKKIFEILDEIIDINFKIPNSGGYVEIRENNNATCKSVKIYVGKRTFALSLDSNKDIFKCFNDVKGIKKKNDGVLFFYKQDNLIVLLIELKSNNPKGYLTQLKAGKNFIEYVLKQINLLYDFSIDFNKVKYFGILFRTIPAKGTTKKSKIKFEDRSGLKCATLSCNTEIKLIRIKEAIND